MSKIIVPPECTRIYKYPFMEPKKHVYKGRDILNAIDNVENFRTSSHYFVKANKDLLISLIKEDEVYIHESFQNWESWHSFLEKLISESIRDCF